jgi:hypothetical protein
MANGFPSHLKFAICQLPFEMLFSADRLLPTGYAPGLG